MGKSCKRCCKKRKCGGKCYKRDYITRTTKCKGSCIPTTGQILQATQPFGGRFTQSCDTVVGRGTVGCIGNSLADPAACGFDARFDHLTTGSYPGSTESHLHRDRAGNIYCHSHAGGDRSHAHDTCGQDHYLGRVSDCRALTRDPDSVDKDVLGNHLPSSFCNNNTQCPDGQLCVNGCCTSSARLSSSRPYNGNLVGGFRDLPSGAICNNCRFTSASYCDGSSLGHCNLSNLSPANCNTLPPQSINTRQKTPDLRGINNDGLSCITGSLCGSKRPTVCRTKIKEVYCC